MSSPVKKELVREDGAEPYTPKFDEQGYELIDTEEGQLPVVQTVNRNNNYTPGQLSRIESIYLAIGQCLPTEGLDYDVKISFDNPDGKPRVSLRGKTPLGEAFVKSVAERMRNKLNQ